MWDARGCYALRCYILIFTYTCITFVEIHFTISCALNAFAKVYYCFLDFLLQEWERQNSATGLYILIIALSASVTILADFGPEFNFPFRWRSKHQTKITVQK